MAVNNVPLFLHSMYNHTLCTILLGKCVKLFFLLIAAIQKAAPRGPGSEELRLTLTAPPNLFRNSVHKDKTTVLNVCCFGQKPKN